MHAAGLRPGARAAMVRVAVLLGLLFAAGMTLRGRLPTPQSTVRAAGDGGGSLTGMVALLSVSMLVMAFAMLNRPQRPPSPPAREFPEAARGNRAWNLRLGLIAIGLLIAWLLAVLVLNRLGVGRDGRAPELPGSLPDSSGAAPSATAPTTRAPTRSDTYRLLMATTAALVVMMVVATVLSAARRPRLEPVPAGGPAAEPAAPETPAPLALAAERGLAEVVNPHLAPREAIIACYAAMERALASAPDAAPQASDTPSEVLARAVGNRALSPGNASRLVGLFAEARYSPHVMTEQHRQSAEQALRSVLGELRSTV